MLSYEMDEWWNVLMVKVLSTDSKEQPELWQEYFIVRFWRQGIVGYKAS
jgi:hypothetical protein